MNRGPRLALCGALAVALGACSSGSRSTAPDSRQEATSPTTPLLPQSVRRLSVAELSRAASVLVGRSVDWTEALPPDARQHGFSRSLAESVDTLTLQQLDAAAKRVAAALDYASASLPACAAAAAPSDTACASEVTRELATRAFRRPPTPVELTSLLALFGAAADATFRDGVEFVVRALLGSPELLYETALGAAPSTTSPRVPARVLLADDELANQLAWLVSGAPPDAELSRAAARGELRAGSGRRGQAQRLLGASDSRALYRRFIEEWLGVTRLRELSKSTSVIANFSELRPALFAETDAVVDDVMITSGGSLDRLFAGGYSLVPAELAELYGIQAPAAEQRLSLAKLGRVGLLQHASFLATFAHPDESAPVLRGKAVLERLLCRTLPKPAELGIDLVLPPPNPAATTRERFARHVESARCASCHDIIDGVGFTFENFDAAGRLRTSQAGKPVDSSGQLRLDGQDLVFADSAELARALAGSDELASCAARQLVRFAAGGEAPDVEDDFIEQTRALPSSERRSLAGLMLAFVENDRFAWRAVP